MTIIDLVSGCSDVISKRSLETETARAVPDDLIRTIGATGAFHLFVPASLDGAAVDPMTGSEVVEELSRADGSTGWTSMILNTTFFTAWLHPEAARPMLATDPQLGMAGTFAPIGRIEQVGDDAVRLTGRYPFNSGSPHATWFCSGGFMPGAESIEGWRFLFVPRSEVEIIDTWRVAGLRGTASHDVNIDGAVVPLAHTASPMFENATHDEPHFRWSFFSLLGALMSGFPLGVARRALDEFTEMSPTRGRGGGEPLATEQVAQLEVARCEGAVRAARSFVHDALGSAWETALIGDEVPLEQRVAVKLAAHNAMRVCIEVVDTVFSLSGGSSLYEHSPIQRCWRDAHAGSSHIYFSNNHRALTGRALLGQPAEEYLL